MADWTQQPDVETGVNSLYSTATFLWNARFRTKNLIGGETVSAKGTLQTGGADGHYNNFNNTDGSMRWAATPPSSAYTLVLAMVFPTASTTTAAQLFAIPGGNVRVETHTTGGGVYLGVVHTGVAQSAGYPIISAVGGFDTEMWCLVLRYTGTQLSIYLKRGDGSTMTTTTETIGYSNAGSSNVDLGDVFNNPGNGLYAVMVVPADVGNTEAEALRDNPWKMFASVSNAPKRSLLLGVG